jgi:hypothetical protein
MRNVSIDQRNADSAELYRLYLDYLAQSREEIESRTVPGSFRERLLSNYRPIPMEHFEARLESLRADPAEYAATVQSLQRGFVPAE